MQACVRTFGAFATLVMGLGLAAAACSSADEAGADGSSSGGGASSGGPGSSTTGATAQGTKPVGDGCTTGADCASNSCKAGKCAAPAPDDGAKNGDETDVDCGGPTAPKCAVGKTCAAHGDCDSDACGADKKCTEFRSCTGTAGATTCGEAGKSDNCCQMIPIQSGGTSFKIDKYQATAGRMRAFVERTKGDIKGWIATAQPKGWNDAWSDELPSNMDEALFLLGPGEKRGCNVEFQGGRTYWQDPIDGNAKEKSDLSQAALDAKALNCVTWHMAAALCAFDGKRLAKSTEITTVFKNGGASKNPWNDPAYSGAADDHLNHRYNYETPNAPANMRLQNDGFKLDKAFYISVPGAFPSGANKDGVQDMAGNVMPWVADSAKRFVWTFSWEDHKGDLSAQTWQQQDGSQAYYAIGIRCAQD